MDAASGASDGPEALAVSAARLYAEGQHAQALEVLTQLARERADDTKVAHNRGLAAYRAGVISREELLSQLTALVASLTQLAVAERPGGDVAAAAGGHPHAGDRDATGVEGGQPPAADAQDASDTALPALNAAIVLWQTGRRSAALALAEPLWRCVEALPHGGQTRLCLLLLDGHLDACQPGKAQAVATFMATHLAASRPEVALTVHVARARAHCLEGAHKAAKRELKEASTVVTQMQHQGVSPASGGSVTGWVAQVQAHCLKAQQELSRCNTGKAVRLLAAAQAVAASEGRADPDAAQQQQGVEHPQSSSSAPLRATLAANGGAVLHAQGRHAAAAVAYEQALAWASAPGGGGGVLADLAAEQVDAITYAAGLQYLLCGSFSAAFNHFLRCSSRFSRARPSLWLRLAECCMCAAAEGDTGAAPPHPVEAVLGEAPHPVLLLARASPAAMGNSDGDTTPDAPDLGICDAGRDGKPQAAMSIGFAALCLCNVEHLLDTAQGGGTGTEALPAADGAALPAGGGQASQREVQLLRCALLTWRSYLHLLTSNVRAALADAMSLLELAASSAGVGGEVTLLARCHAAEALCALGRPAEAVEHLSACLLEREEVDAGEGGGKGQQQRRGSPVKEGLHSDSQEHNNTPGGGGDGPDDGPSGSSTGGFVTDATQARRVAHLSGDAARVALYVNLASLYCSQGEHGAAHGCCTTALALQPRSVHALLALAYVELGRGEVDAARAVLAKGRPMLLSELNR